MKEEKISMHILFLFCLFLYPVMIKGSSSLSYAYIYGIPLLYLVINYKLLRNISLFQYIGFFVSVILVLLSLVYPSYHGTYDYSYFTVTTFVFRKSIIYLFLVCLIVNKYEKKACIEMFMFYYALTHAIYVVVTIIFVVFPSIKNIWFSIFSEGKDSAELLESYGYTFRIGWQGFSGYRLTLHCTICCLFLLYLYFSNKSNYQIKSLQFLVAFGLCFLGNMFYGRTGLVLTTVTSLVALFVWNRMHFIRVIIILFVASVFLFLLYSFRDAPLISEWYNWMSRPIINLMTTGSFNNYSVDNMRSMLFLPEPSTVLLGDGLFTQNGHYYLNTDSGIMRNILFWGIGGALISYGLTLYTISIIGFKSILLSFLIVIVFAVFEIKGDVYYEFISLFLSVCSLDVIQYNLIKISAAEKS